MSTNRTLLKIIAVIAFILQVFSLIIINMNPVESYELSIYANIEIAILLLLLSSFCGIGIILSSINCKPKKPVFLGIIILINVFLIYLSIPILKGYLFYEFADPFSHIGIIKDLINSGHFSNENFYPIFHILILQISEFSSLSPITIMSSISIMLSIFFIISFYLLNTIIFKEYKKTIFASLISIIPFIQTYYTAGTPNGFSFMLVPLILFLYFKNRIDQRIGLSILLLIFIIIIPFTHPLTTIMLIVIFTTLEVSLHIYRFIVRRRDDNNKIKPKFNFNLIIISLATFFTWISSYTIFNKSMFRVISWTMGELNPPTASINASFGKLNFSFFDQLILFLKMYFPNVFFIILSLFTSLSLLKRIFSKKKLNVEDRNMFMLLSCFFISGFMMVIALVTGDPNLLPLRSMNFVFLISIPTAGYGLYLVWERIHLYNPNKQKLAKTIIFCFIAVSFTTGCLSIFDSPFINQPAPDVTQSQMSGITWFFENKNQSIMNTRLEVSAPHRYAEAIYGTDYTKNRSDLYKYSGWKTTVPENFGYKNYSNIGNFYNNTTYLPITLFDELSYTKIWNQYRYSKDSFIKLEYDNTANLIFDNGDLNVWFIT